MSNIACRIFAEQVKLLKSLPEEDAKNILYYALINSYNQFDNQNENQIDNQNANQIYLYLNQLSISIYNIFLKNIKWKEFSDNYGGKREGAGKPKSDDQIKNLIGKNVIPFGKYKIDNEFNIMNVPDIQTYIDEVGERIVLEVESWLKKKMANQMVDKQFICQQIVKFSRKQGVL